MVFMGAFVFSQERNDITLELGYEVNATWNSINRSCGAIIVPDLQSSIIGTGFVIDNMIITASHVVTDQKELFFASNDLSRPYEIELVHNMPEEDIAVLKFKDDFKTSSLNLGKFTDIEMHASVMLVGFDKHKNMLSKIASFPVVLGVGNFVNVSGPNDFIETNADVLPIYTGGPLFNGRGEVIALFRSGYVRENLKTGDRGVMAIAVSIDPLREFLESYKLMVENTGLKSND